MPPLCTVITLYTAPLWSFRLCLVLPPHVAVTQPELVQIPEMAKAAVAKDKAPPAIKEKKILTQTKKKKKKKEFWKNHPKIAAKDEKVKKVPPVLPPRTPQEFSSNWRALQALLKPESTSPAPASTKPPKKQEKGLKKEEKGKEKVEPTAAPKINGHVKETPAIKEPVTTEKRKGTTKKRKLFEERDKCHPKKKPSEENAAEPPKIDLWFDDVDPDDIEAALGPEAGSVARQMQGLPEKASDNVDRVLVKDRAFEGLRGLHIRRGPDRHTRNVTLSSPFCARLTRTVAMDCEMVGVGKDGEESVLARVSIVNQFGKCVYDKFVKPTERVTDYRTAGEDYKVVQKEVSELLRGRVLVGHAIHNDLKVSDDLHRDFLIEASFA
ncbi:LOW QUALITY PROTEIN: RNA exonuclease 4-like [Anomaloglossus baeobatrachus]|uniref:LOW QUALITY PROTEIN: RNA exonuclease 4-like n=1 Tax=Anomaloglossus baeobatrachus TaxID=238106 RepID=UPI003F504B13